MCLKLVTTSFYIIYESGCTVALNTKGVDIKAGIIHLVLQQRESVEYSVDTSYYQRNKREGNPTSFLITEDTAVSVSC